MKPVHNNGSRIHQLYTFFSTLSTLSTRYSACSAVFVFLFLFLTISPVWSQPVVTPLKERFSADRLSRLTTMLDSYVEQERLAGGVVYVGGVDETVYEHSFGYRDREAGENMQADAIFRIASQSKAIISVAIMKLQEEGKLLITDPVGSYLPEFQTTTVAVESGEGTYEVVDAERPVTLRHLLTHTSGIDYGHGIASDAWEEAGLQGWYFADREEPVRETLRQMADLPFQHQPGEEYTYGYSVDILGGVIEEVSGKSLDRYLKEEIFVPLGMEDTHFYLPRSKRNRLSVVYSVTEDGTLERAPDPGGAIGQGHYLEGPRTSLSGGAGLLSTARDYARFLKMLLNGGELDGQRILSPKTVDLMTVNHLGDVSFRKGQGFGLGFYVVEDTGDRGIPGSAGEYGWSGAYHSSYWVDPEEQMIVVFLTQLIPAAGSDVREKTRALIYQALID